MSLPIKEMFVPLSLIMLLGACGLPEKDDPDPTEYANLSVTAPNEDEGGDLVMTRATCTADADTGFFTAELTGENGIALSVKIKGFSTTDSRYECAQAEDNAEGTVGNKFDSCTVKLTLADPDDSTNTYAMHRDEDTDKAFSYGGMCSLNTTYEEPRLIVAVTCDGLVQTHLQGAPRNPIDEAVTASIAPGSNFFCDL